MLVQANAVNVLPHGIVTTSLRAAVLYLMYFNEVDASLQKIMTVLSSQKHSMLLLERIKMYVLRDVSFHFVIYGVARRTAK